MVSRSDTVTVTVTVTVTITVSDKRAAELAAQ